MTAFPKPRVKVCGITRLEDALALDRMGVDYLGFNFWPGSKRHIDPVQAAAIIAQLQNAEPVGVFVNHSAVEIADIAAHSGIRRVQLHGHEDWDTIGKVALPVIKAIPQDRIGDWGGLKAGWEKYPGKQPEYFLVDSKTDKGFGGTGTAFDWRLLLEGNLPVPFFLAGGIGPENLAAAVAACRPFAVDLNSRVETAPGVKDVGLVKRCLAILASPDETP